MKLTPVFLDFESFWSADHTMSKMSPIEYVMSPKTEIISVAIKVGDYPTDVIFGEDKIRHVLSKLDWSNKMAIGHNMSGFDSMILAWRFGIQPAMWGCTAAMARPKYAKTTGVRLEALAKEFGIGAKLDLEATNTKGKYLKDFTPEELDAMSEYNKVDTELCAALFKRLVKGFPKDELVLIHLTTQMLVNPKFVLDKGLLEAALSVERTNKHKALLDLAKLIRECQGAIEIEWSDEEAVAEFVRSEMASAPRFAKLLESCGVEVPMKPSPTNPTKQVPALAKTDEGFLKLQDHPNPLVASAARTRLSVKSTILETRLEAFLRAGAACGGKLPVPLKYCGADTTGRWSGEQYNCMTEGHEVLTPVGWVDIKNWTPELPIMQWWPDGSASWDEAAKKVEYDHDGPVAVLDGPFTKGVFTLDHRVPSIRGKRRTVKDYTAGWVAKHSGLDGVPAAGVYVGGPGTFSPDQTRLLVATSADATVTDTQIRWGFRCQRKIDRIMRLFADCGLTDLVRVYDYRGKPGGHWVAVLLRSRAPSWLRKGFGPWLLGLSRESLDALVDELPHWDGSKHSRTGNTCFYTSQADQAEWVSTALHLSGKPARVGQRADNKLDVYVRGTVTTSATGRLSTFKGRVYCPQVASGYVFVRYAGSIHVTGNCQNLPRIGPKPKTSDALRNSLKAPKGHKVVVADLSGIELRVNHFLWKVQSSMDLYAEDAEADLYRAFAAARYGVKPEEVTKEQRQLAKLCLAEGTLVLTDRGEVPIEQVTASDKVWDGVEWVSTLGPVFKGVKDVIEYDGLVATPDHEVWVEDGRKVPLRYAATQSLRLARTGDAGVPLGFGGTGVERDAEVEGVSGGTDTLHELRHSEVGQLRQPSSWPDAGLPTVPAEVRGTCVALEEDGSREATLHQPERRGLQAVRRSGDSVPVPVGGGGRSVGDGQPWPAPGQGAGPHGQQRPLRAGKLAVGKPQAECSQSRAQQVENLSPVSGDAPGGSLCGQHSAKPAEQGADVRGDCGSVEPPIRQTQRRVWDLLNCGPRHRFTANGRLVSNCQLGLGFGAGWRTFKRVAKLMGGLDLSDEDAEAVTTAWRATYHDIVQGWRRCHDALPDILQGTSNLIDPWGMCETELGAIRLPSGRRIYYPALRTEVDTNGKKEWWYGEGRHKARIYAGKITENCLAEGTLVLTDSGWKPIELVSLDDRVHDGIEFVNHAGVVFKSVQPCITLDGVYMTPDHEVLTDDGWKEASQVQRPYRPDLRGVDRFAPGSAHGQVVEVALPVPVRTAGCKTGVGRDKGDQARRHAKLRVPDPATGVQGEHQARDEQTPRLRRLALYAGSVQIAVAQGVQKLRRAGDHGLRAVAGVVRQLLVGHGAYVPAWAGPGPDRQQRPVFTGELPVGGSSNQHHEQAGVRSVGGHPSVERGYWDQSQHALQPTEIGLVSGGANSPTLARKPVYDILNCGPRHRFVVKGLDGPMVVHNCVQALARDVIAGNAIDFWRATRFEPVLMVHDELVYVVPEADAQSALDELQKIMRTPPKWWPELVTWSEGDIADSYGAAK